MGVNHKFYACHFSDMHKVLELHYIPIALCSYCPDWYIGLSYRELEAPEDIKSDRYRHQFVKRYHREVLGRLDANKVAQKLCQMADEVSDLPVALILEN